MKKTGRILSLAVILVMLATAVCFADTTNASANVDGTINTTGTLTLKSTYPKDGSKGASIENMSVKLYLDGTFTEEKLKDKNADAIEFVDDEGKKLPTRVLYNKAEKGVVLVIVDNDKKGRTITGKSNAKYTLNISGDLIDDNGNVLGEDQSISFTTINQNANNLISMVMMFGMFGSIMFISMKGAKKQAAEQEQRQKEEKVNPYKEAKKTGKSVEEIVEQDRKNKEKQAAKEARKAAREAEEYEDELEDGIYRVKGPRPIAAAGGKYITGRKAEAEARRAEEEALKAKKQQYKAKKGKGKKKK